MRSKIREFRTELLILVMTLISSLVSLYFERGSAGGSFPLGTYLSIVFGTILATSTLLLRHHLTEAINDRLELYSLLEEIEDDELYHAGKKAIESCQMKLSELASGKLELQLHELFSSMIKRAEKARQRILATHVGTDLRTYGGWKRYEGARKWLDVNSQLARDGRAQVHRIFILEKETALNPMNKELLRETIEILREQQERGITVTVVWIEDLADQTTVEDFIIFDQREVLVFKPVHGRQDQHIITVRKNPTDVDCYESKFQGLRNVGQPLDPVLVELENHISNANLAPQ